MKELLKKWENEIESLKEQLRSKAGNYNYADWHKDGKLIGILSCIVDLREMVLKEERFKEELLKTVKRYKNCEEETFHILDDHLGKTKEDEKMCAICGTLITVGEVCEECAKNNKPFEHDSDKHEFLGGDRLDK